MCLQRAAFLPTRGGGRAETRDIRPPRSIVKQLGRGVAQAGGAKAGGAEAGAPGLSISIEDERANSQHTVSNGITFVTVLEDIE